MCISFSRMVSGLCIYYLFVASFLHQRKLMVFHWSLRDSKSLQVSRTLFSILVDLNNAIVWMVSDFSVFFTKPLEIVPSTPITIGITNTFMFRSFFFSSLGLGTYLSLHVYSVVSRNSKVHYSAGFLSLILLCVRLLLGTTCLLIFVHSFVGTSCLLWLLQSLLGNACLLQCVRFLTVISCLFPALSTSWFLLFVRYLTFFATRSVHIWYIIFVAVYSVLTWYIKFVAVCSVLIWYVYHVCCCVFGPYLVPHLCFCFFVP